jgi:CRISPR-associated protein Csx3
MSAIQLDLFPHTTQDGRSYQHLHIRLTKPKIDLADLKSVQFPGVVRDGQGVVLEGKAPLWVYGCLFQYCQQAAWVGCYEPRLMGAIVAVERGSSNLLGQVLPLDLPARCFVKTSSELPIIDDPWVVVMNADLQLQTINLDTVDGISQALAINISSRIEPDAPVSYINGEKTLSNLISPGKLMSLALPEKLDLQQEVTFFGSGPTWLYIHLLERCKSAPLVKFYDLQQKASVIVASQDQSKPVGTATPVVFSQSPGQAILVGGPPDSGKSVFSNALRCSLLNHDPQMKLYLHRANWDGESNASHEMPQLLARKLADEHEIKLHRQENAEELVTNYFISHAKAVDNIRSVMDLTLVDVGGIAQIEKTPVVKQCTHYIIISSKPEKIQEWHDLCSPHLKPLIVIHSRREQCFKVLQEEPFLEVEAGPWERGKTRGVPDVILQNVLNLSSSSGLDQ